VPIARGGGDQESNLQTMCATRRRPRDRNDLIGLEKNHGELPIDPIPGLDN
jgi:hypothetical protein